MDGCLVAGLAELPCKHEGRSPLILARLMPDLAVHQMDELLADCQSEPRSLILARHEMVDLIERLEQMNGTIRGDAETGIPDRESQRDSLFVHRQARYGDRDLPARRELDRVA